jgi:hypothetical protein
MGLVWLGTTKVRHRGIDEFFFQNVDLALAKGGAEPL